MNEHPPHSQISCMESGKEGVNHLLSKPVILQILENNFKPSQEPEVNNKNNQDHNPFRRKKKEIKQQLSLPNEDVDPNEFYNIPDPPPEPTAKEKIDAFLESIPVTVFMTVVTLYALFGDDMRILVTDKDGDEIFSIITIITMFFFSLEIFLASIAKKDYACGFFFWLDILSTVSMVLDIIWVSDALFSSGSGSSAASVGQLARAGRASRVGTKAGRIVRIVRLIRLVKLYKHAQQALEKEAMKMDEEKEYSDIQVSEDDEELNQNGEGDVQKRPSQNSRQGSLQLQNGLHQQNNQISMEKLKRQVSKLQRAHTLQKQSTLQRNKNKGQDGEKTDDKAQIVNENIQETKVGQKLSDLTTRRVITIVLSILFSVPLFSIETFREENTSYDNGLNQIYQNRQTKELLNEQFNNYVDFHKTLNSPVISVEMTLSDDCCFYQSVDPLTLRNQDQQSFLLSVDDELVGVSIISIEQEQSLTAILSIVRTVFVSIVLGTGAVTFSKDVQDYVLTPIENMLNKVQRIAENPLAAAQIEEKEALAMEQLKNDEKFQELEKQEDIQKFETSILEKLIIKIGALLALGFGEAGSQIIAKNMAGSGEVDPLIPGKKILAIFGFCDIRNFTDATEVLQENVMVFVNEIAEIVHGIVNSFSGSANKNIGDAFLLVWKFQKSDYYLTGEVNLFMLKLFYKEKNLSLELYDRLHIRQYADMSVISFVKIVSNITISLKLSKYRDHEGLNKRLPNYSVKMGFGLHFGWAIEVNIQEYQQQDSQKGAIGSNFKIDASYLSPHVNMASRLEAATKQFGSIILISGQLKEILTQECGDKLRHIDKVTVKGSSKPVGKKEDNHNIQDIYTIDLIVDNLFKKIKVKKDKYDLSGLTKIQQKKNRVIMRIKRDQRFENIRKGSIQIAQMFKVDKELSLMTSKFKKEFFDLWHTAFTYYLLGNWENALKFLNQTLNMIDGHTDGPSNTLINFIKEEVPNLKEWKGYRELTEK